MIDKRPQTDQDLANALPEGIMFLSQDGHVKWCNAVAIELLSLEPEAIFNKHIDRVLHKKLFHRLREDKTLEVKLPSCPNSYIQMNLRAYYGDRWLVIVRDVTLTHKLETMRKDFVANVSHELRTPLTVFQGYLELLKEDSESSAERLSEIVVTMQSQADRMHHLVEDLLLLSRLESVEPDMQRYQAVPVASMLHNICDDAISLSGKNSHQIVLELDETLTLNADPAELRSAFSNLVYNAVHYTPAAGTITVRWYQKEGVKLMEVQDTGIGIEAKHISRITQRFYRVDKARSSAAGGTGLGLALVKHVLLRHNGDLEIESKLGSGSLFRCIFY